MIAGPTEPAAGSTSLLLPDFFLLLFLLFVEAGAFVCQLLLDLLRVLELLRGKCLVELLLQEDFALGELPFVNAIDFGEDESTEDLREKLANFYAKRTLTQTPIEPEDQAEAIFLLVSPRLSKTTGHVIPVDGGLQDGFLR